MTAPTGLRHGKATVPHREIEQMRDMYENHGMAPHVIAEKFEVSLNTLWDWLLYRTRINA